MSDDDRREPLPPVNLAAAVQRVEWLWSRLDKFATTSSDLRDVQALRAVLDAVTRHE